MYRIKRFSSLSLEQKEFNRRTKLKRKLDRATLNAEMHTNKAVKADLKAEKIIGKASPTPDNAKKVLSALNKSERSHKAALNDSKAAGDIMKSIRKKSPNSLKLNEGVGNNMNSGSNVSAITTRKGESRIIRETSKGVTNITPGVRVSSTTSKVNPGHSSSSGRLESIARSKRSINRIIDGAPFSSSKSSAKKILGKNKKALMIGAGVAALGGAAGLAYKKSK